jgi:hypothetical protein
LNLISPGSCSAFLMRAGPAPSMVMSAALSCASVKGIFS